MNKKIIWNKAHELLQETMQKEISAMREILSNMHQEEQCILLDDKSSLAMIMQERSILVATLSDLRSKRIQATQRLSEDAELKNADAPLEQLLPENDFNSCEVLSLRDQIMALVDRMNFQNGRNDLLFNQMGQKSKGPQKLPSVQQQKKKAYLATYEKE